MTKKEILNTPEIVDFMIDKSVMVDSKMKLHKRLDELCKLAIKALEQEPCEDAVSRQAVIDEIEFYQINPQHFDFVSLIDNIKDLQSVNPQKIGHWFVDERPESNRETICSNCEQPIFKYHKLDFDYRPKYCPNCGTKMIETHESEE